MIVFLDHGALGAIDLRHAVGNFEIHDLRRALEALGVFEAFENLAAIGAFALEHGARIMQAMRQYADLAIGGRNELAVEPDQVRTLVEGHCHGVASLGVDGPFVAESLAALLWAFCARPLGFCVGRELPVRSHLPYESAFRRPDNLAPGYEPRAPLP